MKFLPLLITSIIVLAAPMSYADAPPADTSTTGPAASTPADTLPGAGFPADRYAVLWTKSPFAVATSDTVGEESPDYFLVGVANVAGISYASVIERQNQEHFLISTDKANRGLTLKSINHNQDNTQTYAVVEKDGQSLTLKLEQAPASTGGIQGAPPINAMPTTPGSFAPQIPMPGSSSFQGNGSVRPFVRFHRPPIHLPPQQAPQVPPTPPPAPAPQ